MAAKHHTDLLFCRKQPGIAVGRLCERCDGRCVLCDSYVRPTTIVRICDECNFGTAQGKCLVCGGTGYSDAYYCKSCTLMEKDVSKAILLIFREMVVLKLSILDLLGQTCFTNVRSIRSSHSLYLDLIKFLKKH